MLLLTNNLQEECAAHASAEDGQQMVLVSLIHYIALFYQVELFPYASICLHPAIVDITLNRLEVSVGSP
jgi:hypothetical protein